MSRKYSRTTGSREYRTWARETSSATGRSFAIVNSTGSRRAAPRSVDWIGNLAATKGFTSELRGEQRAARPRQHRRRHRHHRRREEEQHRVQVQEIAIADWSASPAPRIRKEHEEDERGRREAQERQHPPRVEPAAREEPQRDRHAPREEVRHEAEMAARRRSTRRCAAKRFGNSDGSSTLSASESFVVISTLWRACASCSQVCSGESNGKLV